LVFSNEQSRGRIGDKQIRGWGYWGLTPTPHRQEVMNYKKGMLVVIAVTLLGGGITRILATRAVFELVSIGELWMEQPYSLYIYRALGGFVVLAGIVLLALARDPERYRTVLRACSLGFLMIGVVMIASGLSLGLPLRHYLPDPLYCFGVAGLLLILTR
jgi:hypothetical protein